MINISNEFKTAMKQPVKSIFAYIETTSSGNITQDDDLVSYSISCNNAGLLGTVAKSCTINLLGNHEVLLNDYINLFVGTYVKKTLDEPLQEADLLDDNGVVIQEGQTIYEIDVVEYMSLGTFYINDVEVSKDKDSTTLKGIDFMVKTYKTYAPIFTYPLSLFDFAQAICLECGLELENNTFVHADLSIEVDYYKNIHGITYRDILKEIAECTGSIAIINSNNKLEFKRLFNTNETLTSDNLFELDVKEKYGVINSLVLGRTPQEDNIFLSDETSILENGLTELKIDNNQLLDKRRQDVIEPIYNAMLGISYVPFSAKTEGLGWYEIGDKISIQLGEGDLVYFLDDYDNWFYNYFMPIMSNTTLIDPVFESSYYDMFINPNMHETTIEELIEVLLTYNVPLYVNAGETLDTCILGFDLVVDGGFKETLKAEAPIKSETNYKRAGGIIDRIKNTEIVVDKQQQYIESIVSDFQEVIDEHGNIAINEEFTKIKQDIDNINFSIQSSGGMNLLKNSVMYITENGGKYPIHWDIDGEIVPLKKNTFNKDVHILENIISSNFNLNNPTRPNPATYVVPYNSHYQYILFSWDKVAFEELETYLNSALPLVNRDLIQNAITGVYTTTGSTNTYNLFQNKNGMYQFILESNSNATYRKTFYFSSITPTIASSTQWQNFINSLMIQVSNIPFDLDNQQVLEYEPFFRTIENGLSTTAKVEAEIMTKSGQYFTLKGLSAKQIINVRPNDEDFIYSFSTKIIKGVFGSCYIKIYNELELYVIELEEGQESFYNEYEIEGMKPLQNYYIVEFWGDEFYGASFTDNMFVLGDKKAQWKQANGELANTQVNINEEGITVKSNKYNDYTAITPLEFAGYSDNKKVFSLNRDVTEVAKLEAREQIEMSPIKIVPIRSGNITGWAFVSNKGGSN